MIAYVSCLCPVYESVPCGSSASNIELNDDNVLIYQRHLRTIANDDEFEIPSSHGMLPAPVFSFVRKIVVACT